MAADSPDPMIIQLRGLLEDEIKRQADPLAGLGLRLTLMSALVDSLIERYPVLTARAGKSGNPQPFQ